MVTCERALGTWEDEFAHCEKFLSSGDLSGLDPKIVRFVQLMYDNRDKLGTIPRWSCEGHSLGAYGYIIFFPTGDENVEKFFYKFIEDTIEKEYLGVTLSICFLTTGNDTFRKHYTLEFDPTSKMFDCFKTCLENFNV